MLKRLRNSLMSPLAAKLDKLMERMSQSFKRQDAHQAESAGQLKERMSMLARQVDEARNEFHRGFRIQEESVAELKRQLGQLLSTLHRLERRSIRTENQEVVGSQHQVAAARSVEHPPVSEERASAHHSAGNGLVDMLVAAGGQWLASRRGVDAPRVSVVMPVWNRRDFVERALRSVQSQTVAQWECVVVDDGSGDDTTARVEALSREDPRILLIRREHQGAAAARNTALRQARGDIVAYLDSDNTYSPDYLAHVVKAFDGDPALMCCYTGQRVVGEGDRPDWVRQESFDWQRLLKENFIDLNVFAHRREMWEKLGGFDESLKRLQDWDLILRYTQHSRAAAIPAICGEYRSDAENRIAGTESKGIATFQIRQKFQKPSKGSEQKVRVLYVLWQYPQLDESVVRHEMAAALEAGFEVEAWAEREGAAPFKADVPVHRGPLRDAVGQFKPDVIHVHWLNLARFKLGELGAAGVPVTIRSGSFDFNPPVVDELVASPVVRGVYLAPRQLRAYGKTEAKVSSLRVGIHPQWHRPPDGKDRQLVVRAGGAAHAGDYHTFLEAARLCPDHEFVLLVCHHAEEAKVIEELRALNQSVGGHAAILVDLQHELVAQWMMRAGICLHTVRPDGADAATSSMPISIIESMACGCVPILPRRPDLAEVFGEAEPLWYDDAEAAASMVRSTMAWSDAEWNRRGNLSLDFVYPHLISSEANSSLFDAWRAMATSRQKARAQQG